MYSFFTMNSVNITDCGPDSSVDTAIRYRLEGSGIESREGGGAKFSARVQTGPGTHPASYTSSTRVKERLELYLYSPTGPSWPVLG